MSDRGGSKKFVFARTFVMDDPKGNKLYFFAKYYKFISIFESNKSSTKTQINSNKQA